MNLKKLHTISNILFVIALATSGYALIKSYIDRMNLPEGVCPTDVNRPMLILGIVFIGIYLIVSTIEWFLKKKGTKDKE